MKAVGFFEPKPISHPEALLDLECKDPTIKENDLLVEVKAVSVNPVDCKQRASRKAIEGEPVILGWDCAGKIVGKGGAAKGLNVGDEVYYAGDLQRPGTDAELHAIDYRLVGKKPKNLSFVEAAALPLTTLTAYEALFEQLKVPHDKKCSVLIIGGAGGVGSIAIQLLHSLSQAQIYATYGRPESLQHIKELGAHVPVDRSTKWESLPEFDFIFSTTHTLEYIDVLPKIIRPFGEICLIDDPKTFDITPFKRKSAGVHWEFMFSKSMFNFMPESQGAILNELSSLIEQGKIRSTTNITLKGLSAKNFRQAHELLESGKTVGKITVEF